MVENQDRCLIYGIIDNCFPLENGERIGTVMTINARTDNLLFVSQPKIIIFDPADAGSRTPVVLSIPVLYFIFPLLPGVIWIISN